MISEDKILRFYAEALEQNHPSPERAVFGRLGISGSDVSFEDESSMGLFAVSKTLLKSIGMDITDNAEASFKAMIHFDTKHISEINDVPQALARTAAEKDVEAYTKKIDASVQEFSDKIEWEANKPVRFKPEVEALAPEIEEDNDPLSDKEDIDAVKDEAKRITAELSNQSKYDVSLGLEVDARREYDRLVLLLKSAIKQMV